MTAMGAGLILAWIAIILLGLGLGAMLSQVRQLRSLVSPMDAGTRRVAPDVPLEGGGTLRAPYIILSLNSKCDICSSILEEAAGVLVRLKESGHRVAVLFDHDYLDALRTTDRYGLPVTQDISLVGTLGILAYPWITVSDTHQVIVGSDPYRKDRLERFLTLSPLAGGTNV